MRKELVETGAVIEGRFRVGQPLGRGGMAVVYEAADLHGGGTVAVKVLRPEAARNVEAVQRFRREGELLERVSSPAVVRVERFGQLEDGKLYLVMERLVGETFGELLRRKGHLEVDELTTILAGIVAGLGSAHSIGVVHRDLKPENIFLARQTPDEPYQVKLLDFGICKLMDDNRLTRTGQILGTPRYMAPEQLAAERDIDVRVDVYALGVMLYQALAGQPPFLASTPSELVVAILSGRFAPLKSLCPDLDPHYHAIVARAMARSRDARFATVRELLEAWLAVTPPVKKKKHVPASRGARTAMMGATDPSTLGAKQGALQPGTFPQPIHPVSHVDGPTQLDPDFAAEVLRAHSQPPPPRSGSTSEMAELSGTPVPGASGFAPTSTPQPASPLSASAAAPKFSTRAAPAAGSALASTANAATSGSPAVPPSGAHQPGHSGGVPAHPSGGYAAHPSGGYADDPSGEIVLPTTGGRWKLLLVALLAGALSAGAVYAAMTLMRGDRAAASSEPAGTGPVAAPPETPSSPPATAMAAAPEPIPAEPVAAEPTPDALEQQPERDPEERPPEERPPEEREPSENVGAVSSRMEVRAGGMRPRGASMSGSSSSGAGGSGPLVDVATGAPMMSRPPAMTEEMSLVARLNAARQAYLGNDPGRCLELLDALGQYPSSTALRLKGDCQRRAGQQSAALRSYETFCRRFPNNYAIDEVRGLVDALGGRCP